jgi:hypothetical protein
LDGSGRYLDPHCFFGFVIQPQMNLILKAIGGKEGKGSRRIFVRLQGATAGA